MKTIPGHDREVWQTIHQRLQEARQSLNSALSLSPEKNKAVLRARAKALAEKLPSEERTSEWLEAVSFTLAGEVYALESRFVERALILHRYTPLPGTPHYVVGVISLASQIVSLIDLREFFGLPRRGLGDLNKVLILRSGAMTFGILADTLIGTCRISMDSLQESLHTLTDARESYIQGITPDRRIVLDGERLLGDRQIGVSETSAEISVQRKRSKE